MNDHLQSILFLIVLAIVLAIFIGWFTVHLIFMRRRLPPIFMRHRLPRLKAVKRSRKVPTDDQ